MSDTLRPYKDLFPEIGQRVMIDTSSVVIGDVRLADDVGIWPLVVIRGDVNYVAIGARTNIQDGRRSSRNPQVSIQSTRQPINHWRRCYRWP
ncbi:transferase [Salmonella enterica subsp. arizonae]|uniref:Transferase n=1 Tax=Salmonella enterica subsp. arizonae TaxID=59203 RepID=A0A379RY27_SALER|nr:transferase [Salmonella enterica subsp. arizonae]